MSSDGVIAWDVKMMYDEWEQRRLRALKRKREEQLKAMRHVSPLDYGIWTLQVNPNAQNVDTTEENARKYADQVRGFRNGY